MVRYNEFFSENANAMRPSAIRRMSAIVAARSDIISLAGGMPDPEAFPLKDIREFLLSLLEKEGARALQYSTTGGLPSLVEALRAYLKERRGILAEKDEIIPVSGSQQGLDLIARLFLNPGDVVFVELPSYIGATAAFNNVRAEMIGIRKRGASLDIDDLVAKIEMAKRAGKKTKLIYLIPNFQNPTGHTLPRADRRAVLDIASRYDLLIFEDDPYGELYFSDADPSELIPIKAYDAEKRVIYLNTLSKVFVPGLRVAWLTAAPEIISKVELAKQAADICVSTLGQKLSCAYLQSVHLPEHIRKLRSFYERKCRLMLSALGDVVADSARWISPKGGFFVWLELNADVDTDILVQEAIEREKIAYVPGSPFFVDGSGKNTLRLSFSSEKDDALVEGVKRLGRLLVRACSQAKGAQVP